MKDIKRAIHINYKDGSTRQISPPPGGSESFNDLTMEEKRNINSLVLQVGDQKYTISRIIKNGNEKTRLEGYFYHAMEGYTSIMGGVTEQVPFAAERIGFCYNALGDAISIHINYMTGNIVNNDENVQMLRQAVEMYWELPKGTVRKYRSEYKPFREIISSYKTQGKLPLVVNKQEDIPPDYDDSEVPALVLPQIPGLPLKGTIPRVLFNSKDVSHYNVKK